MREENSKQTARAALTWNGMKNTLVVWGSVALAGVMALVAATLLYTFLGTPVRLAMNDRYALGENVGISAKNYGVVPHSYNREYPACHNLQFFDDSGQPLATMPSEPGEAGEPRRFIIPQGTHCDLFITKMIGPFGEADTLRWSQLECVEDNWGCVASAPVAPGKYRVVGSFPMGSGSFTSSLRKGPQTVVEKTFIIACADGSDPANVPSPAHRC